MKYLLIFTLLAGLFSFSAIANSSDIILTQPQFPQSEVEIKQLYNDFLAYYHDRVDSWLALDDEVLTFENTILMLEDLGSQAGDLFGILGIVENAFPQAALREQAHKTSLEFEQFFLAEAYREDVYKKTKTYLDNLDRPLSALEQRLADDILNDYKRIGLHLPKEQQQQLQALQQELSELTSLFSKNIRETQLPITVNLEQLAGIPQDFLDSLAKTTDKNSGKEQVTLYANRNPHYRQVITYAKDESLRQQFSTARASLAKDKNEDLLFTILQKRQSFAALLGYETWAAYKVADRMAKTPATVLNFLDDLAVAVQPKLKEEQQQLINLKAQTSTKPFKLWDVSYYKQLYLKEHYQFDSQVLKNYFSMEASLQGMFELYELLFGIKIEQIENPDPWSEGVTLHTITDTQSQETLGLFYLDLYPREGKYNHFAQFGIIDARVNYEGKKQRPTVALICNFSPPLGEQPSLLSIGEVETLFHEFGHVLHSVLTQAPYGRFSGTSVPRDFVEAPSQVLEYWVKEKAVLDRFAKHWKTGESIPNEYLVSLKASEQAFMGTQYARQVGYARVDFTLHQQGYSYKNGAELTKLTNQILLDNYNLNQPEGSSFICGFGHLMGYDASYYGYAWSDVIAADMASEFAKTDYINPELGMKLRKTIFEVGNTIDINESITNFLGRERSFKPFQEKLGIINETQ